MSYAPPRPDMGVPPGRRIGAVGAAACLDLLQSDPASVLSRPLGGRQRGEKSAAKLARERYEAELRRSQAAPVDLLDFDDSPPTASAPSQPAPAAPPATLASPAAFSPASPTSGWEVYSSPPVGGACSGGASASSASPVSADVDPAAAVGLWPGDTVMARYGPSGGHYRARVVRVYSNRGSIWADVEWLRPQAFGVPPGEAGEFLCNDAAADETMHRHGLQVGRDINVPQIARDAGVIRPPPLGSSAGRLATAAIPGEVLSAPPAVAPSGVFDLLGFDSPVARPQGSPADLMMSTPPPPLTHTARLESPQGAPLPSLATAHPLGSMAALGLPAANGAPVGFAPTNLQAAAAMASTPNGAAQASSAAGRPLGGGSGTGPGVGTSFAGFATNGAGPYELDRVGAAPSPASAAASPPGAADLFNFVPALLSQASDPRMPSAAATNGG
mmetsp:Transcript_123296/g.356264  ORF Transcript_123296/g.356264 Transcript_123296/m.356264 type:complete len:444 (-) Transcript_123296:95-1426(-)